MKSIRWLLGKLVLFYDAVVPVRALVRRSDAEQARVDAQTASMALYQFTACPFCVKVRRAARALNLRLEIRDALRDPTSRKELLERGGKSKVPCLRITENGQDTWMYESSEIVRYLHARFAAAAAAAA